MICIIYKIKYFSINFFNIFSHKITREIKKISSRKIREASEEKNSENDREQNELFKAYVKYFEDIMSELIHSEYNSSIYNDTPLKEHDYKLLVLTILAYTDELQQVINLLDNNNCIFI